MSYYILHVNGEVERFDDQVSIYDLIEDYNAKFGREATEVDDTTQYTFTANGMDLVFILNADQTLEINRALTRYYPKSRVAGPVYVTCFDEDDVDACIEFNIDYLYNFKLVDREQFELEE